MMTIPMPATRAGPGGMSAVMTSEAPSFRARTEPRSAAAPPRSFLRSPAPAPRMSSTSKARIASPMSSASPWRATMAAILAPGGRSMDSIMNCPCQHGDDARVRSASLVEEVRRIVDDIGGSADVCDQSRERTAGKSGQHRFRKSPCLAASSISRRAPKRSLGARQSPLAARTYSEYLASANANAPWSGAFPGVEGNNGIERRGTSSNPARAS